MISIMMTKIRKSRMSDFSCEKTKVCMDSLAVPMARERSVSDVCEVLALGWSFRGEL